MISFKDFYYLSDLDKVVIDAPIQSIPKNGVLNEGRWVESGKKDWMIRVDAADPAIPLRRHVHIARKKHTSSKTHQASWNDDQTRHDKGTFNKSIGSMSVVQDLARTALGLSSTAILEHVISARKLLVESAQDPSSINIVYMRLDGA